MGIFIPSVVEKVLYPDASLKDNAVAFSSCRMALLAEKGVGKRGPEKGVGDKSQSFSFVTDPFNSR